jgi:hypothetical protein
MVVKVDTVRLRVADLGFAEGALTREIIGSERDTDLFGNAAPFTGGRGKQLGLGLCPADLAPRLCLEYPDRPSGERQYIAMRPITASDGEPRIFVVARDSAGLSLDTARARPDDKWEPDDMFVFCSAQSMAHDSR